MFESTGSVIFVDQIQWFAKATRFISTGMNILFICRSFFPYHRNVEEVFRRGTSFSRAKISDRLGTVK